MTASPLVQAVERRLADVGYSILPTPFRIAGVEFAFTGAMRGRDGRALDLVLLVDTTTGDFGDRDAARVRQRIEALSRALDVTGSRYVVTAILAGAVLAEGIDLLSETCRVLQVDGIHLDPGGNLLDEAARRQLDDRIRVLLPLTLPVVETTGGDSGATALEQLVRALPAETDKSLINAVLEASDADEEAVTEAAAHVLVAAIEAREGESAP
ncbi:hypothetical protein ACO2Q3_11905 [Caulobacter sp. KR2-114]|uniref:hypothetical protein n=1 Tax=Caulobacter sp. KR2-114 TaxID=3400912 RepID=UPI003C095840